MIEALRNQLKNHDEKTTRKNKDSYQENELEKKFEELETLIEEYQDSRANWNFYQIFLLSLKIINSFVN